MVPTVLAVRASPSNPNHHLWNNNGTWFIHYVAYDPDYKNTRIRASLGTKSLSQAKHLRDRFFSQCIACQMEVNHG